MECENTSNESPDTVIPFPPSLPRPPFNLLAAILNGHAQDGSGSVARALVHLVVEAVVFVAVVDVEDLTCAGYIAGNATIYGDSVCVCVCGVCVCGVCGVCACVCVCVCGVCVVCVCVWCAQAYGTSVQCINHFGQCSFFPSTLPPHLHLINGSWSTSSSELSDLVRAMAQSCVSCDGAMDSWSKTRANSSCRSLSTKNSDPLSASTSEQAAVCVGEGGEGRGEGGERGEGRGGEGTGRGEGVGKGVIAQVYIINLTRINK